MFQWHSCICVPVRALSAWTHTRWRCGSSSGTTWSWATSCGPFYPRPSSQSPTCTWLSSSSGRGVRASANTSTRASVSNCHTVSCWLPIKVLTCALLRWSSLLKTVDWTLRVNEPLLYHTHCRYCVSHTCALILMARCGQSLYLLGLSKESLSSWPKAYKQNAVTAHPLKPFHIMLVCCFCNQYH